MTQVVNAPTRKRSAPSHLPHHGRSDDLLGKFRLLPAEVNPPWLKVLRAFRTQ